jgi:catechol 2,3-dioxygenase-like lactoylglutathione lyase family enzyme
MIGTAHLIFFVGDQEASRRFHAAVLDLEPTLHVPGMTEFRLGPGCVLGLMPAAGIRRLLGDRLPDPGGAAGVPRAELYLVVDDPARYHERALRHGARELSGLTRRSWGDRVAYSICPDGHVLAFASRDQPDTAPHPGAGSPGSEGVS